MTSRSGPDLRYELWRLGRIGRMARRAVFRRLYRDRDRALDRAILIAGSGRSGTTWLADLLQRELHARILFEPFHSRKVDDYRGFHYFHYLRPDENEPDMESFCRKLFSGDIRHPWIDRQIEVIKPSARVVKAIRANLVLGWIKRRFPQVPLVLVMRHPCAVVLSRMELGWDTDGDLSPLLEQPNLVSDHLGDLMPVIERASEPEEKHALVWCIHNLVPLRQLDPSTYHRIFYEDLLQRPEIEIPQLFAALGRPYGEEIFRRIARPSVTSSRDSAVIHGGDALARWQTKLTRDQIARILDIVRAFGLDGLYDEEPTPRLTSTR